jgi:hypothetical protein
LLERKELAVLKQWKIQAFVAVIAVLAAGALAVAAKAAAPSNTAPPTISGTEREGSTLTAENGTWSGSPTSFTYQWQRCTNDGLSCGDISSATEKTYTLVTGDVSHAMRVIVTAVNADGRTSAPSETSETVSAKGGPTVAVKPVVSGTAAVGEELSSTTGTWVPPTATTTRQWQRCDEGGAACRNIAGATGRTYGVRTADNGHRLRVRVAARTSGGVAYAASNPTAVVGGGSTTSTVTTTVQGNKAPTIVFLSLRRVGVRVYARFRVCDDKLGRLTIIERDNKARTLSATRRFGVVRSASCGTFSRNWIPAARFRTKGRYVVTLRAQDTSGALSRIVSRSLVR